MTRREIVIEAIVKLNKVKNTAIEITEITEFEHAVRVRIQLNKTGGIKTLNFNGSWFDPTRLADLPYLNDFILPSQIKDKDQIAILKIAFYIYSAIRAENW